MKSVPEHVNKGAIIPLSSLRSPSKALFVPNRNAAPNAFNIQ